METVITTEDWAAYVAGLGERRERPADPGDVRFEVIRNPEPDDPASLFFVRMIDDRGILVESYYSEDGYAAVEAYREFQAMPDLEERLDYYIDRFGYDF